MSNTTQHDAIVRKAKAVFDGTAHDGQGMRRALECTFMENLEANVPPEWRWLTLDLRDRELCPGPVGERQAALIRVYLGAFLDGYFACRG